MADYYVLWSDQELPYEAPTITYVNLNKRSDYLHLQAIDSRWNQHGLGGDILRGDCR